MTGPKQDGGLTVTPKMKEILDQPGFISIRTGSERLRAMFQTQFAEFDPNQLPAFTLACLCGNFDAVKEAIESGTAPNLTSTETPFQFGFVTFTVFGAQRLQPLPSNNTPMRHLDTLAYLISAGAPPNILDVSGHTALHHACTPPAGHAEITKLLLEKGADVNAQNRYGEVPICLPFQGGDIPLIDLLMEHGADLDIPDGNGDSPRKMCMIYGAAVTAAVQRWERKRRGEAAPLQENRCENCKVARSGLRQCARCHVVRYCSTECQRAHWKTHKPNCHSFSAETNVTLVPTYQTTSATVSRADLMRQSFGLPTSNPVMRPGMSVKNMATRAEDKGMVIKVQVPVDLLTNSPVDSMLGSLYIYNKKRDFVCTVGRTSNPAAYDAVVKVVRSRGVGGAKAYFLAELKNPHELVVKISEVLAEQPF